MANYAEWRRLEQEFRDFQTRHPNLYASWTSLDGQWAGFGGPEGEQDRFRALCGVGAAMDGSAVAGDPVTHWLNLVREYLLESNSELLTVGSHVRKETVVNGSATGQVPLDQGQGIINLVEARRRLIQTEEFDARIKKLEQLLLNHSAPSEAGSE